jgi:hypothetical protein
MKPPFRSFTAGCAGRRAAQGPTRLRSCHRLRLRVRSGHCPMLRFLLRSRTRTIPLPLYNPLFPPLPYPSSALTRMQFVSHLHPPMLDHHPSQFPDYPHDSFPPESPVFDQEQLIFGPLEIDDRRQDPTLSFPWDANGALPSSPATAHSVTASPASSASLLDFGTSPPSSDFSFTPGSFPGLTEVNPAFIELDDRNLYSNWLVDDLSLASSAPVPISATQNAQPQTMFGDTHSLAFPKMGPFSPSLEFASLHPLPRSVDDTPVASISPPQLSQPSWAAQLWARSGPTAFNASPLPHLLHPPDESDNFATQRPLRARKDSLSAHAIFQSSSAPSGLHVHKPPLARGYSSSVYMDDDPDATVRRKRKVSDLDPSVVGDQTRQAEGSFVLSVVCSAPADMSSITVQFPTSLSCDPPSWLPQLGSFTLRTGFSATRRLALANSMWRRRPRKPVWSMPG